MINYNKILEDIQARREAEENEKLEAARLEEIEAKRRAEEAERKAKEEEENRKRREAEYKKAKIEDSQFYLQFNGELLAVYEGIYEKLEGIGDEITELAQKQLAFFNEKYPNSSISPFNSERHDMLHMRDKIRGLRNGYKVRAEGLKKEIEKNVLTLHEAGKLPKSPRR